LPFYTLPFARNNEDHTFGFKGDEPEYELWAGFGPLIGNSDMQATAVIANEADRLGLDGNEGAWLTAWIIECSEKGVLSRETLNNLNLKWGNVEAVRALLHKVAFREGVGNILAEGTMRASKNFGDNAKTLAIYTNKGNTRECMTIVPVGR